MAVGLLKSVNALGFISNLISCAILVLVMRLLHIKTNSVQIGKETVNEKNTVNLVVTGSHIIITLAFSISQVLPIFYRAVITETRMLSSVYLFGGACELFLSVMIWFILDGNKAQIILVDGDRVYAV